MFDLPFEDFGLGCPKGISIMEQLAWQISHRHPMLQDLSDQLPDLVCQALNFEFGSDPQKVDAMRSEWMSFFAMQAN